MNWKIIFFDLDGTLVNKDFFLTKQVLAGVKEIRKLGLRVSVATGRSQESARKFLEALEIEENVVVHNGAVVIDKKFRPQVVETLDTQLIAELVDFHSQYPLSFKIHFSDCRIIKSTKKSWAGEGVHFEEGQVIEDLRGLEFKGAVKVVFCEEAQKINKLKNFLEFKMKVRFLKTHMNTIELLPTNVNKARGIAKILEAEDFGMEQVIAVGDNENDKEMIQRAGIGISTGDEFPLLQEISRYHFANLSVGGMTELVGCLARLR